MKQQSDFSFEAAYPLKNRFRQLALPALLFLTVLIGFIMSNGSSWLVEQIYLEISENRAAIIDRALREEAPDTWEALQTSDIPRQLFTSPQGQDLLTGLRGEVKELGLSHLKIYGNQGLMLYSSEEEQIGKFDPSTGYRQARRGQRTLVEKQLSDGKKLYELYVRVPDNANAIVMELYEPVNYLDTISLKVILPATLIPVAVLLLLGWSMNKLVSRAQNDIDYRTSLLSDFQNRLQELVSDEAVSTLRAVTGKGGSTSRRARATILFSDIRGFTDFCENETPEHVVSFLDQSLGTVIDAVKHHEGDVDKLIGDAVLAHFQGPHAETRAFNAARDAITAMKKAGLPRGIGIGIYAGDVVMGTVGASRRKDFTVIGDPVNVAARLCSAARQGEIVIERNCIEKANLTTAPYEELCVKGREETLTVARLKP